MKSGPVPHVQKFIRIRDGKVRDDPLPEDSEEIASTSMWLCGFHGSSVITSINATRNR